MKILIVEDDATSANILTEIFSDYGDCKIADRGRLALELCRTAWQNDTPFDLICLDIMMPEMDGQQVLLAIRQEEEKLGIAEDRRAKIIMITALDTPENVIEAYKGGATSYIVKPIEKMKLLRELNKFRLI